EIRALVLEGAMDADAAKEAATPLFRIVRGKVRRFMTTVTDQIEPGPMDWIFETRAYGVKIRYTTAAAPTVDGVGDRVEYQKMRIGMGGARGHAARGGARGAGSDGRAADGGGARGSAEYCVGAARGRP